MQDTDTSILIKHLEELRKKAVKEQPTSDFTKYWSYYSGEAEKGKGQTDQNQRNKYNVIKGIIDTKTTLILDNEIVSTVMPRLKTFVDEQGLSLQNDIADILRDINAFVLDNNNFEKVKSEVVLNKLVYGIGYTETVWQQDDEEELGDIKINSLNPINCFPDASAKDVKDCNYFFIKESFSSITLKKKYPAYASKMQSTLDKEPTDNSEKQPSGVFTYSNDGTTSQSFSYGDTSSISESKQKNVTVWKCYLKDDSTFVAKETEKGADPKEANLRFKYPHGRLIVYVDGAKDYVLEDKTIDYPFGFPIDVFTSSTTNIFGVSQVKYLVDIQDRINRAWERVQYLVASYVSLLVVDPNLLFEPDDIINQAILVPEDGALLSGESIVNITNNTLGELNEMLQYIDVLKKTAYEISRVNPTMISGERPEGVNSGEQVVQLNQSPMLAIKEEQRHFKYFVCEQGKKNIVLIQLFYNTPRMIRLTDSKQVAELPATIDQQNPDNQGLQQQPIRILEQQQQQNPQTGEMQTYYKAIKEIKSDLSIGEYDMQVIAGTEMPRSRTERAQITMQLANMGMLGNDKIDVAEAVLTALDYPQRHLILEKMREQSEQASKQPPIEPPTKDISVKFDTLHPVAQGEWYQNNGFPQAAAILLNQQTQNINHLQEVKKLIEE